MEAAAGAENFRGVIFQRIAAGERGNFVAHDVLRAKAGESFPDFNLGDALLRGVQDEPADEGDPKAGAKRPMEGGPNAEQIIAYATIFPLVPA